MTGNGHDQPPDLFNVELEQALIGAVLHDNDVYYDAAKIITSQDFAAPLHAAIWQTCHDLISVGRTADPTVIKTAIVQWYAEHEKDDGDPNKYVKELAINRAPNGATKDYARELSELRMRREMIDASRNAGYLASTSPMGKPMAAVLDEVAGVFSDLRERNHVTGSANDMSAAMQESLNRSAEAYKADILPGIPWFMRELTMLTGEPLQFGSLYGLLSDPGGGKTSLAMQQAYSAAAAGYPAIMFSYEQTPAQCADQIHAQQLGIEAIHIRQGRITMDDFDRVHEHATAASKLPFTVQNAAGCTASDLRVRTQSFVRRHGKALVIVDHAKRVIPYDQRAGLSDRVNQVYGDLKSLALDLDCAVLLLMQRNSKGFDRRNPEPVDEDCYGGAGAKENLDYLIAIWREVLWMEQRCRLEKNQERISEWDGKITAARDKAKLINLKARFSRTGGVEHVKFVDNLTRFVSPRQDAVEPRMI